MALTPDEAIARGEAKIAEGGTYYLLGGNGPKGYDCSHFVAYCYNTTYAFTGAMVSTYTALGFQHYSYGSVSLKKGDILVWNKPGTTGADANGHTVIYLSSGRYLQSTTGGPQISSRNSSLAYQDVLRSPNQGIRLVQWIPG